MRASDAQQQWSQVGDFSELAPLGGPASEVFRARSPNRSRYVALRLWFGAGIEEMDAVRDRVERASHVSHPTLATVESCEERGDGALWIVSEYVPGPSLAAWYEGGRLLPLSAAIDLVRRLSLGLQLALDLGISHHTVTPRNIIVRRQDPRGGGLKLEAKLLDLEMAAWMRPGLPSLPAAHFMAPEALALALAGDDPDPCLDARANVYACGALLYYLATGVFAFDSADYSQLTAALAGGAPIAPRRLNPRITEALERVLTDALCISPGGRQSDPASFASALELCAVRVRSTWVQSAQTLPDAMEAARTFAQSGEPAAAASGAKAEPDAPAESSPFESWDAMVRELTNLDEPASPPVPAVSEPAPSAVSEENAAARFSARETLRGPLLDAWPSPVQPATLVDVTRSTVDRSEPETQSAGAPEVLHIYAQPEPEDERVASELAAAGDDLGPPIVYSQPEEDEEPVTVQTPEAPAAELALQVQGESHSDRGDHGDRGDHEAEWDELELMHSSEDDAPELEYADSHPSREDGADSMAIDDVDELIETRALGRRSEVDLGLDEFAVTRPIPCLAKDVAALPDAVAQASAIEWRGEDAADHLAPHAADHLTPHAADHLAPHAADRLTPHAADRLTPHAADHLTPHAVDHLAPHAADRLTPHAADRLTPHAADDLAPHAADDLAPHAADHDDQLARPRVVRADDELGLGELADDDSDRTSDEELARSRAIRADDELGLDELADDGSDRTSDEEFAEPRALEWHAEDDTGLVRLDVQDPATWSVDQDLDALQADLDAVVAQRTGGFAAAHEWPAPAGIAAHPSPFPKPHFQAAPAVETLSYRGTAVQTAAAQLDAAQLHAAQLRAAQRQAYAELDGARAQVEASRRGPSDLEARPQAIASAPAAQSLYAPPFGSALESSSDALERESAPPPFPLPPSVRHPSQPAFAPSVRAPSQPGFAAPTVRHPSQPAFVPSVRVPSRPAFAPSVRASSQPAIAPSVRHASQPGFASSGVPPQPAIAPFSQPPSGRAPSQPPSAHIASGRPPSQVNLAQSLSLSASGSALPQTAPAHPPSGRPVSQTNLAASVSHTPNGRPVSQTNLAASVSHTPSERPATQAQASGAYTPSGRAPSQPSWSSQTPSGRPAAPNTMNTTTGRAYDDRPQTNLGQPATPAPAGRPVSQTNLAAAHAPRARRATLPPTPPAQVYGQPGPRATQQLPLRLERVSRLSMPAGRMRWSFPIWLSLAALAAAAISYFVVMRFTKPEPTPTLMSTLAAPTEPVPTGSAAPSAKPESAAP